jgi:hypothetical protein
VFILLNILERAACSSAVGSLLVVGGGTEVEVDSEVGEGERTAMT